RRITWCGRPMLSLVSLFFFYCYGAPRDLHSFPTRRSSDLAREALDEAREIFERLGATMWEERARTELSRIGGRAPSRFELTPARSEEHTSELQSPYDLVCRLLLEKKKQKRNKNKAYYHTAQ